MVGSLVFVLVFHELREVIKRALAVRITHVLDMALIFTRLVTKALITFIIDHLIAAALLAVEWLDIEDATAKVLQDTEVVQFSHVVHWVNTYPLCRVRSQILILLDI